MVAFEEPVELEVVLVAVDDDAVRFVMDEEQFRDVGAVAQRAIEYPCQARAFRVVVAVVPL